MPTGKIGIAGDYNRGWVQLKDPVTDELLNFTNNPLPLREKTWFPVGALRPLNA